MKQPCRNCPFLKHNSYSLSGVKLKKILDALSHDQAMHCHKTVDYSGSFDGKIKNDSELCFGSVLFMENAIQGGCRSNLSYRFGLMRKEFGLDDLRKSESIYSDFSDFMSMAK